LITLNTCNPSKQHNRNLQTVSNKTVLLTPEELHHVCCALIKYQTDLRARTKLMERFANPEHLANHRAKIALGEKLLEDLS
jgi:hypothetical protein